MLKRKERNLESVTDIFEFIRICGFLCEPLGVYVVEFLGVFLDVEVCTYVKSKCIQMGRCSYVGRFKVRTYGKLCLLFYFYLTVGSCYILGGYKPKIFYS